MMYTSIWRKVGFRDAASTRSAHASATTLMLREKAQRGSVLTTISASNIYPGALCSVPSSREHSTSTSHTYRQYPTITSISKDTPRCLSRRLLLQNLDPWVHMWVDCKMLRVCMGSHGSHRLCACDEHVHNIAICKGSQNA